MSTVVDLQIKVLDTIDKELSRIHDELDSHTSSGAPSYTELLRQASMLNTEIIRLSKSLDERNNDSTGE